MRTKSICPAIVLVVLCSMASAQWVHTNGPDGGTVYCFAISGTNIFAGTEGGVFLSTDNGTNWTPANSGIGDSHFVWSLVSNGTNLVAAAASGVFLSTDNGASWIEVNSPLVGHYVKALAFSGANLFAGTTGSHVFRSTNNGASWTHVYTFLDSTELDVRAFVVSGTNLFVGAGHTSLARGTQWGGVSLSTDNGTSWTRADSGLTSTDVKSLAVSGTNLFAGTGTGVFLSTNRGASWAQMNSGLADTSVTTLGVSGTNLLAGTDGGVFLSTNNGTSWIQVNEGLTDTLVSALAVTSTNLLVGTHMSGVWRRPLSEMIASIDPILNELPDKFSLDQNYPNPFNPTTTIKYDLPRASHVSLSVYDVLGREIVTLLNEEKSPGTYTIQWDATGVSSGVYFYRLRAGDFVRTRRMLILK